MLKYTEYLIYFKASGRDNYFGHKKATSMELLLSEWQNLDNMSEKREYIFSSFRLRGTLHCFSFYKTFSNPFLIVMYFSNVLETTWCIIFYKLH